MVFAHHDWCEECDTETMHHNHKCTKCAEKERRLERARWLALENDEKIEELLKRIERLEEGPAQY